LPTFVGTGIDARGTVVIPETGREAMRVLNRAADAITFRLKKRPILEERASFFYRAISFDVLLDPDPAGTRVTVVLRPQERGRVQESDHVDRAIEAFLNRIARGRPSLLERTACWAAWSAPQFLVLVLWALAWWAKPGPVVTALMIVWWLLSPAFVDLGYRMMVGVELRRERRWVPVVAAALAAWTLVMIVLHSLAGWRVIVPAGGSVAL
jgi:hypothetical protein